MALDPARQAVQEITDNIMKVIDDKLSSQAQTLQVHALELHNLRKRTDKIARIAGVEVANSQANLWIQVLEREIESMSEHIDDHWWPSTPCFTQPS